MTHLASALADLGDALAKAVDAAFADDGLRVVSEDELLEILSTAGRIQRGAQALLTESVAHIADRERAEGWTADLSARHGCRNVSELIQRATRGSQRSANEIVAAAKAITQPQSFTTGELLPAELPRLRDALAASEVGIDGVNGVVAAFRGSSVGRIEKLAADEELAAAARGEGVDAAPPATADDLRALASVWATYFDQDGAEPREARAMRKRGVTIGRVRDGLRPLRGELLPEVAAQFERIFDSVLNPRVDDVPVCGPYFDEGEGDDSAQPHEFEPNEAKADQRTFAQKRHDALAVILNVAAGSGELPLLGGAAPTLVVSVRQEDLASGRGYAHVSGDDEPLSIAAARHVGCIGAVQRVVFGEGGRIVSLGTVDRTFNHPQRRAIALRDGECIIPGCQVRAEWCEVHHVEEYSRGGPTHTDNGVLLCWFHHRTIDTVGWAVRMNHGAPEVRGPFWWDPLQKWRPVTKSPTRMRDRLVRRA